ncbi:hypothetical protein [Methanobacterium alcaliphilum]|uniref:hypothetical protein n=1 Tax=Methanobacterium alcaliphilum TaxID=392018 RepID=UPI00200A37D1|nr:hypothetical protein [Methanobacterium alcaliphilum]MCK9150612.1 hypothetical protein [Methanobacterium alcaliphilum]
MPYLICNKCEHYYEINSVKEYMEFHTCECGNELIYVNQLSEYDNSLEDPDNNSEGENYAEPYEELGEEEPDYYYGEEEPKIDHYYEEEEYVPSMSTPYQTPTLEQPEKGLGIFIIFVGILLILMNGVFLTMKFNFVYIILIPMGILLAYFGKSIFSGEGAQS